MTNYATTTDEILFKYDWDGNGPLFKNQRDLALQLLANEDSAYFTRQSEQEEYRLNQIRLRTYISQIFSGHNRRKITNDFKKSLTLLITEKLSSANKAYLVVEQIINDLSARNQNQPNTQQLVIQNWETYNDFIEQWITTTITNQPPLDDYKQGQINGIRQGAMLIWGLLYAKITGNTINEQP